MQLICVYWLTIDHFVQKFGCLFLAVLLIIQVYRVRFTNAFMHIVMSACVLVYLFF